jgi:hypothetical protein
MSQEEWSEYVQKTTKNAEGSPRRFRDWQSNHIAKILSFDLDIKEKQEKIRLIVDWPYFGPDKSQRMK